MSIDKLFLLTSVFFSTFCFAQDVYPPQSTADILDKIVHTKQHDLWVTITGIPIFNPQRHSDGCSGGMSQTYTTLKFLHQKYGKVLPWRHCCVVHDQAYYYGGNKQQKVRADKNLKQCVSKTIGNENLGLVLGLMMRGAVHIGGVPYFPTSYRWGYGEDFRGTENLPVHNK